MHQVRQKVQECVHEQEVQEGVQGEKACMQEDVQEMQEDLLQPSVALAAAPAPAHASLRDAD